jgi:hypothetical protein
VVLPGMFPLGHDWHALDLDIVLERVMLLLIHHV